MPDNEPALPPLRAGPLLFDMIQPTNIEHSSLSDWLGGQAERQATPAPPQAPRVGEKDRTNSEERQSSKGANEGKGRGVEEQKITSGTQVALTPVFLAYVRSIL